MNMDARTAEGKERRNQGIFLRYRGFTGQNLWGRKERRNGVQKIPKKQDELIAFSFLKKKHNGKENLDAFPSFPLKSSSGQNQIHGQISAAKRRRANAEIMRAQIGGPGQ